MKASIEVKARHLVASGSVLIVTENSDVTIAEVVGEHNTYRVTRSADGVFEGCSCPSVARCGHIAAVELITTRRSQPEEQTMNPPTEDSDYPTDDHQENPQVAPEAGPVGPQADVEMGEIVANHDDPGVLDAALLPLADAPVTYSTLQFIARTEFVPKALRGRPEAVLAAVLYGRELGLGPMESLIHVDVIDGRPSPSAELLARLIRDAGHQVEVLEASDEACRLRGTRSDTGEVLEVSFTVADAERVTTREHGKRIPLADTKRWREYPGDMCWARAITRLHRRLFPDMTALGSFDPKDRDGE